MISDKRVHQIFEKIGQSVWSSSFLGKGEASTVLKVCTDKGTYALKTALYPERKEKILKEAKFRTFFLENGVSCVPRPVHSDTEIFPNGAVIYEYAEGSKLEVINKSNLKQFARIISEIHRIDYEIIDDGFSQIQKLWQFLDKTTTKIRTKYSHLMNSSIESAFEMALIEFTQKISEKGNVNTIGMNAQLHGDLSDNFVIDEQDKIWLLDWENSEYGDVAEELCWFLYVNKIQPDDRLKFYQEYQKWFIPAKKIKFEEIEEFYYAATPVFNICWGIDQLNTNIKENLEPERKLRDLAKSAKNWKSFYSDTTTSLIIKGINALKEALD
ncbi:MAG: aminoglycoside phosphotransferase family protein [Candidatus Heimdallarchaeota archaeon]|nr:aminoglycoside phosphotransferase family protein [Candidatus Heimdallarchaeota archaeon]